MEVMDVIKLLLEWPTFTFGLGVIVGLLASLLTNELLLWLQPHLEERRRQRLVEDLRQRDHQDEDGYQNWAKQQKTKR
jgi:hypothetical protein